MSVPLETSTIVTTVGTVGTDASPEAEAAGAASVEEAEGPGAEAEVLVGPVVGQVTDTTARILLEISTDATVVLVLTSTDPAVPEVRQPMQFTRSIPAAFHATDLSPSTAYTISFENILSPERFTGQLRTFAPVVRHVRIISGSCDNQSGRGDVDMWHKLNEEYVQPQLVDIVIHNGDQVYADPAFAEGQKYWEEHPELDDETKIAAATQFYSSIYRKTWSHPPTAAVLANCSNLMLWDDHELRNDWGAFTKDRDVDSVNYKLGKAARRAYWYYQRQLWDDLGDSISQKEADTKTDGHLQLMPGGEIGICFMDTRGSRSFYADEKRPFLSCIQWNMFSSALDPVNGAFKAVRKLIIVHSMPVVLIGSGCSRKCGCCVGGDDKMGFGMFPQEQEDYLGMIDTWVNTSFSALDVNNDGVVSKDEFMSRFGSDASTRFERIDADNDGKITQTEFEAEAAALSPRSPEGTGEREVMLLGGDLHFSMETIVKHQKEDRPVLTQIVTSALANKPPMCWAYYPMKWLASCCTSLGHGTYAYEHANHNPINNFASFDVNVAKKISYEIVTAGPSPCCNKRGFLCCFKNYR